MREYGEKIQLPTRKLTAFLMKLCLLLDYVPGFMRQMALVAAGCASSADHFGFPAGGADWLHLDGRGFSLRR
jgi:hypothetical protein